MQMDKGGVGDNLIGLHSHEEQLRRIATQLLVDDARMLLHLRAIERAMDLGDMLRQFDSTDEDFKVIQLLGMRTFNALGASLKLALSGYFQNSALIMRDVLETVFLLDLFEGNRALIAKWRNADKKSRMKDFAPIKVREALDNRHGFTSKKRAETYELFSELAGHPNIKSSWMMRPEKSGPAVIGPFMERSSLEAVISEMGRLAIQVGEQLDSFFQEEWERAVPCRIAFAEIKMEWLNRFYPNRSRPQPSRGQSDE